MKIMSRNVVGMIALATSMIFADVVIEDFASTHQINYAPGVVTEDLGYWYGYADAYGTTATNNIPDGTIITDFTGPVTLTGSLAADNSVDNEYAYSGIGFDLYNSGNVLDASKTTVDVSAHTGITVTYTSSKALFLLMSEAMTDDGAGYYCELAAGNNVTKTCSWSDFTQPGWAADAGLTRSLPTGNLVGFKFQFKESAGNYSLSISNVSFEGGEVTIDPSSSSEISSSSSVISSSSSIITDPGSSDLIIEDFASTHQINYAPNVVAADRGYWYEYSDTFGTTATSNIPDGTVETDFAGPLTFSGSLAANDVDAGNYSYTGVGFDLYNSGNISDASKTAVDVTGHTGITVTYSSSKALFLMMSEAMTDDGAGYYCELAAGNNVTKTCSWSDFTQPGWAADAGLTRSLPTGNLVGFKFQFKDFSGAYSLTINSVAFVGGTRLDDEGTVDPSSSSTTDPSSSSVVSSSSSVISSSSSIITDPGSSDLIIEDFASTHQINYAPNVEAADRGYWYEYSDTFGTTATSNIPDGTVETDFTGPLTFSGNLVANDVDAGNYSYTGVGFDLYNSGNILDASKTAVDVTGHTGITVTYSSSKALFLMMSEAMTDDGAGYYCELAAGNNVTKTCSWSDFTQPGWAADAGLTRFLPTGNLVGFKFQFKDFSGAYSLTINSVAFVGGTRLDDEGTVDPSSSSTTDPSSSSEISSSSSVISSSSSIITDPGSSDLIIEDFASTHQINYAPNVVAADRGYWYEYSDTYGTTATSNIPDGTVETDFTGPLTFSGNLVANDVDAGNYSYTGVGFDLYNSGNILDASKTTVDVTSHTGITVTYTSSKALFLMMSEAMTDDGAGYYCELAAGTNVTKTCSWSDFEQPNWADGAGLTRSLPTANLVGFKFQFKDFSGAYSLTINSVAFVGGTRLDDEGTVDPSSSSTTTDPSSSSTTTDPSSSSTTTDPGVDAVLNVAQNLGLVITNSNIRLDMKNSSFVNVELYNVSGNKVANVFKGISNGNIDWNNANIAEGVYIFKIQALGYSFAKKFVLTK